jgi:hypothetical protein
VIFCFRYNFYPLNLFERVCVSKTFIVKGQHPALNTFILPTSTSLVFIPENLFYILIKLQNNRSSMHESYRLVERPPPGDIEPRTDIQHERSTWKLTIYMSFLKIVFTIGISIALLYWELKAPGQNLTKCIEYRNFENG